MSVVRCWGNDPAIAVHIENASRHLDVIRKAAEEPISAQDRGTEEAACRGDTDAHLESPAKAQVVTDPFVAEQFVDLGDKSRCGVDDFGALSKQGLGARAQKLGIFRLGCRDQVFSPTILNGGLGRDQQDQVRVLRQEVLNAWKPARDDAKRAKIQDAARMRHGWRVRLDVSLDGHFAHVPWLVSINKQFHT